MRLKALLTCCLLFTAAGCVHQPQQPTKSEEKEVVKLGNAACRKLMATLKRNLGMALKEGGLPGAIEFCSRQAQELTEKVNRELVLVKVSRVSDKFRNPKDRPTPLDLKVINYFKEKLKEGKLPPYKVVKVKKGTETYFIYYKPIRVGAFCLNCHGDPRHMDPEVLRILREKYPHDRALGYKVGQLRGVFKVVIPEKALKEG
ncbi:Tll0287-like domain-containing protein [Thermovibrio ammonificans]